MSETFPVNVTESAATKIGTLLEKESDDSLFLRIAVQPGGCSGLRYQLFFDNRELEGDVSRLVETTMNGRDVTVTVDRMSAPYLQDAIIDFVDQIDKQGFTIDNPNAGGTCACGDSFH